MKVTPSNQTLILASERRGAVAPPANSTGQAAASAGSSLQRVTIVAARPDTTVVYLQAARSEEDDAGTSLPTVFKPRASTSLAKQASNPGMFETGGQSVSSSTALVPQRSATASRGTSGNASGSGSGFSAYVNPVEQYARTQRILADNPRVQQIDVHA